MKKRIPTFLAGMATMALIGGLSVSALAASGAMTINVNPVNVQVNGATFAPKDAQGNSVPVFSYNGTTYAPLRALAEAYGLNVGYDKEKNMATVGAAASTETPTPSPSQAPDNTASTDTNRVPDITVDELKALFKFAKKDTPQDEWDKETYIFYRYEGDSDWFEYFRYLNTLNQEDVESAAKAFYLECEGGSTNANLTVCLNYYTEEGVYGNIFHALEMYRRDKDGSIIVNHEYQNGMYQAKT